MEICECGRLPEHHPSLHFAERRDVLIEEVKEFMDRVYPADIFVSPFTREMVTLIAACFITEKELNWRERGSLREREGQ